jgi:hypothetical protein
MAKYPFDNLPTEAGLAPLPAHSAGRRGRPSCRTAAPAVALLILACTLGACHGNPAAHRKARLQKAIATIPRHLSEGVSRLASAADLQSSDTAESSDVDLGYATIVIPADDVSVSRPSAGTLIKASSGLQVFCTGPNEIWPKEIAATRSADFAEMCCDYAGEMPGDSYFEDATDEQVDDLVKLISTQSSRSLRERGVLLVNDAQFVALVHLGSPLVPGGVGISVSSSTRPIFVGVNISSPSFEVSEAAMRCILRSWRWK